MLITKPHALKSAVLLGMACAVGPVLAQDQEAQDQEADRLIEEVVVTAEFREASVQDTPIAITAISGDMLEVRGQTNLYEVTAQSPNVTLKPGGQARSGMMAYIRGIGQSDFIAALEPGVGIYVDDVYYAQLTGSLLELIDVDRIEVLRGPQGTLAGRNSIGGAIKMYTKKPGDGGSHVRVGLGSYSEVNVRATGDFELIKDSIWMRVSGAAKTRDGYVDVLDYGCSHPGSGYPTNALANNCKIGEQGDKQYTTARVALRWAASDDVEVNLIGDYLNDRSGNPAGTLLFADRSIVEGIVLPTGNYLNPTIPLPDGLGGELYYRDHIFVGYGPYANDPLMDPYVSYATFTDYGEQYIGPGTPETGAITVPVNWKPTVFPPRNYIEQWGLSLHVDWDINDTMSFVSITSYREYDTWMTWDEDGSPFPIWTLDNKLDNWQFTQEFRFNGSAGPVDYTLGAFYLDQESTYLARVDLNHALIDFVHGPDPTPADTWAVFAHGVWNVNDRFSIAAGVRYSEEYKGYTHFRHNPDGSDIAGFPDPINIRLSGINGLFAEFEDTQTDWRVAANWNATEDSMLYASVATGYKGGGVNPRPFFPDQLKTFNSETLTAYELGWKSTLFDYHLKLNAAVFYTEYEDIQLILTQCELPLFFNPAGFGPPCLKPANVGDAEIKGVELEATWYITEDFLIDAMASFLDFEYTSVDPFALQGSPIAPMDMITPYTPETKWNLGAQYTFPTTSIGSFTVRADAIYQSETYADPTNSPTNYIDDYTLLNVIAWWDSPEGDWRIEAQCLNCSDEVYYHDLYDNASGWGATLAQPGMPRTYQVAFQKFFD